MVGGGIAGSTFAYTSAQRGINITVLESGTNFWDRVRGEATMPWRVADAKALGLYDILMSAGANLLTYLDSYQGAKRSVHRDLLTTSTPQQPILAC